MRATRDGLTRKNVVVVPIGTKASEERRGAGHARAPEKEDFYAPTTVIVRVISAVVAVFAATVTR